MKLSIRNLEGTKVVASALAPLLVRGDVVLLDGNVGAGKTSFAQALIHAVLGGEIEVTSPTFTLQHGYATSALGMLTHMDLYRIEDEDELYELGLDDAFDTGACLIEWPDRLGSFLPKEYLCLRIEIAQDDARIITVVATTAWNARIKELEHAIARAESPYVTLC